MISLREMLSAYSRSKLFQSCFKIVIDFQLASCRPGLDLVRISMQNFFSVQFGDTKHCNTNLLSFC